MTGSSPKYLGDRGPHGKRPRFPRVKVQLVGTDGNAYAILGRVKNAMREAGIPDAELKQFIGEATAGDYDNLLGTCMLWVNVS